MNRRQLISWTIVGSVIALLLLAYLLIAIPKNDTEEMQEQPLSEITKTDNGEAGDEKNIVPVARIVSDNAFAISDLTKSELNKIRQEIRVSNPDDMPESDDNEYGPGEDSSDDVSDKPGKGHGPPDDKGGAKDSDPETESDEGSQSRCPPMKWGLHKESHHDNANGKADEHRYTCNGKAVGNPFLNGEKQKMGPPWCGAE